MSIEVAKPDETADDDAFIEEGEGTQYNMRELMDEVYKLSDVIFTVPKEDVEILKRGLIVRKGKDNAKVSKAGLATDGMVLSFNVYPNKKNGQVQEGIMDVRVKLGPKKAVRVLEIRVPNDDF